MNVEERGQQAKELRLCFKCLSDAHQMRICSGRLSNVNGFGKPHHRLLHRPYKNVKQKQNVKNVEEVRYFLNEKQWCPTSHSSNDWEREQNAKNVRLVRIWSESVVYRRESNESAKSDGPPVDLNVAGVRGTSDICSKRLRVKIGDQDREANKDIPRYVIPT